MESSDSGRSAQNIVISLGFLSVVITLVGVITALGRIAELLERLLSK